VEELSSVSIEKVLFCNLKESPRFPLIPHRP